MDAIAVLHELYGRIPGEVRRAVDGLSPERLVERPAPEANTIAWLVWHLARVQDHHVSELLGTDQLWATGDWAASFGLEADPDDTGYGHDPADVARVRPTSVEALVAYADAAHARAVSYVDACSDEDLDRVVDERWDPPVTLGVRLVSVADDAIQHAGQASYLRGLLGA
ncbi:mycothiol transferase [Agrococcus sp. SGAir0287]|uniref:mycothiol transferase n=1 Tax=Agrococcus sp. SGAir0287 TaxID=2070347 RepID=UPI0010CD3994|nr:DUF664 domain-containing protein [Agrococcus sp. SGAir0287]QCR19005.1 hypothetical protein C1N71_05745 [Agrococcus sp. SGAir0287]